VARTQQGGRNITETVRFLSKDCLSNLNFAHKGCRSRYKQQENKSKRQTEQGK